MLISNVPYEGAIFRVVFPTWSNHGTECKLTAILLVKATGL